MGVIRIDRFVGAIQAVAPQLIPENAAQAANNCKLVSGNLQPWKGTTTVNTPSKAGTKKTIHLFGAGTWFHWLDEVNVVRGPVANNLERTYFTGDIVPRLTDASIATAGGGTGYPTNSYRLGIPAPVSAPGVALNGTASNAEEVPETRAYVYTYVSAWGEEGPPSPASSTVDWRSGQTVDLSSLPTSPPATPADGVGYNINRIRIYRTNAGSFQFVKELVIGTGTPGGAANDAVAGTALGELLPSAEWDAPPTGMIGLTALPGGVLAGFVGNEICLSVPYQPHAWPVKSRLITDYPIVGLGVFGNSLLVATTGTAYVVTGAATDLPYIEKLEISKPCVARRGIATVGGTVMYPAADGLMAISMGAIVNATEKLLTRDQWQALAPTSMIGASYNGKYFGFYNNGSPGAFILDPQTGLSFLDLNVTAAHTDLLSDSLYLMIGSNIVKWDSGSLLTYTWKSKLFELPRPVTMAAGRVYADTYPVTMKIYADGVLKTGMTVTVANGQPFRLPAGIRASRWELELTGTATVRSVEIATSIAALARG